MRTATSRSRVFITLIVGAIDRRRASRYAPAGIAIRRRAVEAHGGGMRRCFSGLSIGVGFVLAFTAYVRTQTPAQMAAQPQPAQDSDTLFATIYPVSAH